MITFLIVTGSIVVVIMGLGRLLKILNRPRFFKGDLKPLEKKLFAELENNLPATIGHLVPQQLSKLKRGIRIYFPKSYNLELYEDKNNPLQADILFKRQDEYKLATLIFTHGGIKYIAGYKVYAGRIWGINVRPSPKKILGIKNIQPVKFKLDNDPSEELDLNIVTRFYDPEETFEGILGILKSGYDLKDIQKPLPQKQFQLFIKLSEAKFPTDYLDLFKQTNGFTIGEISVYGLGTYESVSLEDGDYLTLAEKGPSCLSIKQSKRNTKFCYFSYEDESDVRELGDNFVSALEAFMKIE